MNTLTIVIGALCGLAGSLISALPLLRFAIDYAALHLRRAFT